MVLKPGDTLLNGQYRILRQLGRGGFGSVYLAQDMLLGELVAIKELIPTLVGDDTVLRRFLAEAKATMRLTYERIVRTYNVFSERGNYYIAMEFMAGGSLEARLRQPGPLPVDDAVRIAVEVCEGLSYAHQRGVVHCDLKPANILFATDGSAKVADFGIAHVSEQVLSRTWQTSVGFVAGTLPYMSPEQADGVRDDPRIDIYALGAVLYRLLAGRTYLEFDQRDTPGAQADNVVRLRSQQVTPPSVNNRRVPPWLDRVVLKALAKEPGNRYNSAEALRAGLLRHEAAAGPVKAAPQPVRPRSKPVRRQRTPSRGWIWLLAAGLVVFLVVAAISIALAYGWQWDGKQPIIVTMVVTSPPTAAPSPTAEPPTPIPTATPAAPTATTVPSSYYRDDFGDPGSGWDVYQTENTQAGYRDGEYRVAVNKAELVTWGNPSLQQEFTDFSVEVDARLVEGPLDNDYGLLVRYQEDSMDFYWFQISSDGYYSVDLHKGGEFVSLVDWKASDAIRQGIGASNRLRVECAGDQFRFYVNGTYLTEVTDGTYRSGNLGLAAGTFEEAGLVAHFDNLEAQAVNE